MTTGYFLRWRTSYHLFPGQIFHPGDVQDVKFPTHVRFTESNFRGLPTLHLPPTILGQTIDGCITLSAVSILHSIRILPLVRSPQSAFYTDPIEKTF